MNTLVAKIIKGCAATVVAVGLPLAVLAQAQPKPSPTPKKTPPMTTPLPMPPPGTVIRPPATWSGKLLRTGGGDYERSIKVNASPKLNLCVSEGMLRVNGWNRNEIRIFIKNGTGLDFNIKAEKEEQPAWVQAFAYDAKKGTRSECLWGDIIEIDAPVKTAIEVRGREYRASLDSINSAYVQTYGGSITARNISNGLNANTGIGNITVEESGGAMELETTGGNIIAFDISPSNIGDPFKAKSANGNISLEGVEHGQVDVSSISGSVNFTGPIRKAGNYTIVTQAGTIRMTLPQDTSCILGAVYGFGTFNMEYPAKLLTEDVGSGPIKKRSFQLGKVGTGAQIKLQTTHGSIFVKKQPAATAP